MNVIFENKDFSLCEVPVPDGYPQSQTHTGIALNQGVYYLTTSPYPSYIGGFFVQHLKSLINRLSKGKLFNNLRAEAYENPCLYVGMPKGENPPSVFKLMQKKPLMDTPEDYYNLPAFNSDPDLYIDKEKLYILNRAVYRTELRPNEPLNKYEIRLYLISGEDDKGRFKLYSMMRLLSSEIRMLVSPCFLNYRGRYYLFELETNSYNDGKSFDGLFFISSDRIDGLKDNNEWTSVRVYAEGLLPWHMSIFENGGRLYAIIACIKEGIKQRCWQMLGEFDLDLKTLKIYRTPLTTLMSYRGSALVTESGEFVLYNTTVHEKFKEGRSVDGREIVMAHKPFTEVLKELENNE